MIILSASRHGHGIQRSPVGLEIQDTGLKLCQLGEYSVGQCRAEPPLCEPDLGQGKAWCLCLKVTCKVKTMTTGL